MFLLVPLCSALLACSSPPEPVEPTYCIASCAPEEPPEVVETTRTLASSGGFSGGIDGASYDANTGVFTLTTPGLTAQMARFSVADYGNMLAMRDGTGMHNAYYGQGTGTEVLVYSGGTVGDMTTLASFARTGETELPLTGTAQFNGDYAGFTTTRRINGKAQLDVDFASETVSGRITDRIFRQRGDNVADVVNPLSIIVLEETSLSADGAFQGVTGGGQIVNGQALWNPATGSYEGLIGGSVGQEAVGAVTLTHRAPSGATFGEVGGFLATR